MRRALQKHRLGACSGRLFRAFAKPSGSEVGRLKYQETLGFARPLVLIFRRLHSTRQWLIQVELIITVQRAFSLYLTSIVGKQHAFCMPNNCSDCLGAYAWGADRVQQRGSVKSKRQQNFAWDCQHILLISAVSQTHLFDPVCRRFSKSPEKH